MTKAVKTTSPLRAGSDEGFAMEDVESQHDVTMMDNIDTPAHKLPE